MRISFTLTSFLVLLFVFTSKVSFAQCSGATCSTPTPEVDPMNACVLPNPGALDCYYGATTTDPPISFPPWCGAIHNNHWFAFTADAPTATFNISVFGCATGNGIQAAVFSTIDCENFTLTSNCLGDVPTQTTQTMTATNLIPGNVYYMCIDGSAGAICDYAINGSVPTVNGPTNGLCIPSSPNGTYTTTTVSQWVIDPPSAGNIVGNSTSASVVVHWNEPGNAQVCATSLQCPNAPQLCLPVTIGEDVHTQEDVNMCQGYSAQCAGKTYTQPGSFVVNLPSFLNCDSLVTCVIHLIPTVTTTEVVYVCPGSSVTCAGEDFDQQGTFPVKLTAWQGCDSVVNCKVNFIQTYNSPMMMVNLCGPAEYPVCDNVLTTSGIYQEHCYGYLGCDSFINVNLAILEPYAVIAPPAIIDCDANSTITLNGSGSSVNTAVGGTTTYNWSGPGIVGFNNLPNIQVNQPGQYCLILTHSRGGVSCRDTACVTVNAVSAVPQLPQITGNVMPCGDSTYVYTATANGSPPPTSFVWTLPGGTPFTTLSLNSIQVTWNTVVSGQICVTANNSCGPSQPACLPLVVQAPIEQPELSGPAVVCADGGDYTYTLDIEQSGVTYTWSVPTGAVLTGSGDTVQVNFLNSVSGQVCVVAQNACGIGTPVCQAVSVSPIPTADLSADAEICAGDSIDLHFALSGNGPFDVIWSEGTLNDIANGHVVKVSPAATHVYKLISVNDNSVPACSVALQDSVTITVWQHVNQTVSASICEGETYTAGGAAQSVSGVYTDSLQTIHGCDSIIVTTLTVNEIDTLVITNASCDPSQVGTFTEIFAQTNGCDSIVIRTTTLLRTDTILLSDKSCDINNVGVFTQELTNIFGCDSTVITTVTFSLSDTTLLSGSSCNPADTGVFYMPLLSADGCDSLIITTITLLPESTTQLSGTSCNFSETGVFPTVLQNQFGCDSTVILTITFVPLDTTFTTGTSCDPAEVGVFTTTLTTAGGCDSILVNTVTQLRIDTTQLTGSSCNLAEVGVFPVVLSNQFGCDSTVITTITFAPLDTTFLTDSTCDPALAGVFSNTIVTAAGCDSVIITSVTLLQSDTTQLTGTSCNPAEVGVFPVVLPNQFGCDSTVVTTITFVPLDTTYISGTTCDASEAGVFTSTIVTAAGCDSVIVNTIIALPSSTTNLSTTTCDPSLAGVFESHYDNYLGCDSLVIETRTLLPESNTTINLTTCEPSEVGSVTQVLQNQHGCDSTIVTITSLLQTNDCAVVATLTGSNIPCLSTTGNLTLTVTIGTAPFTYTVLLGATTVSTGTINSLNTPQAITGLAPGNYTVNVTSGNALNTSNQATIVQLVAPALSSVANSDFSGFDVSCNGESDGQATATATGGLAPYTYAWSNGGTTQQISTLAAGTYTVTVTDANTCTNVSTVTLTQPTPLAVTFTVNDLNCFSQNNGAVKVTASGGAPPYQYSLNNGALQSSEIFNNLASGSYTLVVSDANDCEQTEALAVKAAIEVDVELGDNIYIGLGDSAVLQATVTNIPQDSIESITWTPPIPDSECPGCPEQTVTPLISTVYTVQVKAFNGCSDQDKVTVLVDRRRQVYVPNVFAPNSNSDNNLFSIFTKPKTVTRIVSFQIFDRWGDSMYVLKDFQPNDPAVGWDGTFNGTPMNPGVFVWMAEIEFIDGQHELYKGDVTIVR